MLVAFVAPRLVFGLICGALILHLRPKVRQSAVTVLEPKIESRLVFTNQWRRRKWVVSSKREHCHRLACRVAPVRRRPPPKPNRFHSCGKHRPGTTNGTVRRT